MRAYRILAVAVTATLAIGQLPIHAGAVSAAALSGFDDQTQQQARRDECLLSNVLRIGGPTMKQVAATGLDGDATALHAAADPDYWDATLLDTAYTADRTAESAKLDQLLTYEEQLVWANGTLYLGGLETPSSIPSVPADPWTAAVPVLADPFDDVGLGTWVSQNFWTSEGSFYDDPTPLASADSVTALTALGNSRFHSPQGGDPNFEQDLQEYQSWHGMNAVHDYYADDTRLLLENGGFPRSAPDPGSVEFRVAVEQLKSRFASCASDDPVDPNDVLGAEVQVADTEWHIETAGQETQRDAIYTASAKSEAALAAFRTLDGRRPRCERSRDESL